MSLDTKALLVLVKKNPILSSCGLISLILFVAIYARSGLGSQLQAELDQKSAEGKRYHANLTNSAQLSNELQVVTEANRIVRERSINPADLAKNLQYFYRIEAETGVKFTDLRQLGAGNSSSTGAKRAGAVYVAVNYTMSVSGDFPKIIAFLKNLEQGAHFYRLNSMTASVTGAGTTLVLNVDLLGQP
jgi:hypothetical protein